VIIGGVNEYSSYKSKVANVSLSGTFLANQSQVTTVTLTSLNLKDQIDDLPDLLPSTVDSLTLTNDLLYEFPWTLVDALPALQSLYVTRGDLEMPCWLSHGVFYDDGYRSIQKNYFSSVVAPTTSSYSTITYLYEPLLLASRPEHGLTFVCVLYRVLSNNVIKEFSGSFPNVGTL
jgi:hypothetical protein